MKKQSLFFILACFLFSCNKAFLYYYGVRNPKIETRTTIETYLRSNGLAGDSVYALHDTAALSSFWKSNIGTPEIRFYDERGYLMIYRDNKKCNAQNDSLITFLDTKNIVAVDSSQNLHEYIHSLRTLDGDSIPSEAIRGARYYLVIYWAKWLGKVNRVKLEDWQNALKKKNDPSLHTLLVTTDYMKFWNIRNNEMFKIYSLKTHTRSKKNEKK